MIDEVLYMQTRLFRMFLERTGLDAHKLNDLFVSAGVWDFIATCFDSLHLSSDECAYDDIMRMLEHKGVRV